MKTPWKIGIIFDTAGHGRTRCETYSAHDKHPLED